MADKYVLITGCSNGGIGSALAQEFQKRGIHVFATARSLSKMSNIQALANTTLLTLDITSAISIASAVQAVTNQTGGTLDYLVNNAGAIYTSPILDTDISEAKELFEVNFWGTLSCIQAFTPLLIAAKGTIVNTSSILSILDQPFQSMYCASKAAVTIFDAVLRLELAPFDVKVVTTITGSVASNINLEAAGVPLRSDSLYAEIEGQISDIAHGAHVPNQMSSKDYAEKVVGDILGGTSGRLWRGGNATAVRCLSALPQSVMVCLLLLLTIEVWVNFLE